MNPSKGDCVERGNKLAVEQARSRVIRGSLIELSNALDATADELFGELVWLEQNADDLPRTCQMCSRIFVPARAQAKTFCSKSCRFLATSEVRVTA